MTEQEWLECEEPDNLLLYLYELGYNARKVRLFGCACVRQVWKELGDERLKWAIDVAERFADGLATVDELAEAENQVFPLDLGSGDIIADHGPMAVISLCEVSVSWFRAAESTAAIAAEARFEEGISWDAVHKEQRRLQSAIIRDIFGNPFCPISLNPTSFTTAIVSLAQAAYDDRYFPAGTLDNDRLAILADALEDAGCTNADILGHLRGPGPHVRGCWGLDLLLNKS